jgi:hypothetical protein
LGWQQLLTVAKNTPILLMGKRTALQNERMNLRSLLGQFGQRDGGDWNANGSALGLYAPDQSPQQNPSNNPFPGWQPHHLLTPRHTPGKPGNSEERSVAYLPK